MASFALREKEVIAVSKEPIEACKALPTGLDGHLILASRDRKVHVIRLTDNAAAEPSRVLKSYEGHTKRVTDVIYAANSDKVISVSADNQLIIRDRLGGQAVAFKGHHRAITAVALNHDGNKIVTASEDGSFILWNVEGVQVSIFDKTFENGHKSWINAVSFVPNTVDHLATASDDGTVKIWNLESNCLMKTFFRGALVDYAAAKDTQTPVLDFDYNCAVKALAFSPDGTFLAYGGRNACVYLMNPATNEALQVVTLPDKVTAIAFAANQPLIAIAIPNKIIVWDILETKNAGEYEFAVGGEHYCKSLVFGNNEIIAGLFDGRLIRIDLDRN